MYTALAPSARLRRVPFLWGSRVERLIVIPSQCRCCALPPSFLRPVFLEPLLDMSLEDDGFACRLCLEPPERSSATSSRPLEISLHAVSGLGGLPLMHVDKRRHAELLLAASPFLNAIHLPQVLNPESPGI